MQIVLINIVKHGQKHSIFNCDDFLLIEKQLS